MNEVALKGERDGLAITIGPEGDFDEICSAIVAHLERGASFFRGGRVLLDIGPRALTPEQLETIRSLLSEYDVALTGLRGSDFETRIAARQLGLELSSPTVSHAASDELATGYGEPALIVRRTLRSGQAVYHEGGVVILGDVNPGAQVIAGGDVIVLGALRGLVHAGAGGDESRIVCALELAPTQLRIGTRVARAPEEKRRRRWWKFAPTPRRPEVARVHDNTIVVEPWTH